MMFQNEAFSFLLHPYKATVRGVQGSEPGKYLVYSQNEELLILSLLFTCSVMLWQMNDSLAMRC